ncbi:deoxyribodipyrimidine photo-lyase [Geobacter sulfurreducens]|jgi:deoxyribodipyrimidine photo-lyase|uniref:Deoxyribodipyrimidine photo-lyase n=1 Tax=Geobacter sulfurreducens (strain ATCC 51573 / DSM 12127 / PCA) TaxID=243231 RepID=Q749B5_GEOSL|nr:deoxyribodipyrimidine photo-lyase [Geobacter sulfurreducens]AAR36222.1 deoxyribodipyrimidine photolyase, putative [Geobacter sulfurreducens PCA]ADI85582.1 deoxyribodipyrimidine photolyase, putative [Geobacter sulfurreducens KN400]AJY69096.1 deoxyribodipyrimidine photolyase [Geobacter sulfurreducens]UAC03512.1 deoxyribodipyrimidine photo-lyase [Geobacter sulfurreducens]UTG92149.1 deoxyribodipyrimidine photo-lyase [Geobacter sulfurreducens]
MNCGRIRSLLQGGEATAGPVIYWMSRDQRVADNWALIHAQKLALARSAPLGVLFCLAPRFLGATARQYRFMLKGLEQVRAALNRLDIPFFLVTGDPKGAVAAFTRRHRVSYLVTDFDPLRVKREWKRQVAGEISIPFDEVDAHNIVPCWITSQRQEWGAYTIRPKIHRLLPDFMEPFPPLQRHPFPWQGALPSDAEWRETFTGMTLDESVPEVSWLASGEEAAQAALARFLEDGLAGYATRRNNPAVMGQSGLSPWLHFGQLSAQRVAQAAFAAAAPIESRDAFLEELIVRRELADNFCYYNDAYDRFDGFPEWAQRTLNRHRHDPRPQCYEHDVLEQGQTHDSLWNAAQLEMVRWGRMHGYLRMYWAKKLLEWTSSPEDALMIAIQLNDRYQLDGRDPNGYAGIAWSIGGVHDRPWAERPVFGTIRFMSRDGCRRKFDTDAYERRVIISPATCAGIALCK